MKKVIIVLCLGLSTLFMFSYSVEAKNSAKEDNSKQYVFALVGDVMCEEYGICSTQEIKIKRENIFDINLDKIGYVYNAYAKKAEGKIFVIVLEKDDKLVVEEYVVGESSPFLYKEFKNIYLGYGMYYELRDEYLLDSLNNNVYNYYDVSQWYGIDKEESALIFASSVPDDEPHDETIETYNYYELIEDSNYLTNDFPLMSTQIKNQTNNKGNNCSPTAGLEILLYYDNFYNSLTPVYGVINPLTNLYYNYDDFKSDYETTNNWIELKQVYLDLYDEMGTNDIFGWGTPHRNFLLGLEEYVEDKNFDITVDEIIGDSSDFMAMSNTSFDATDTWIDYRNAIDNGKPVVIQLGGLVSEYYVAIKSGDLTIIEDNYIIYRYGVPYMYYDTVEYQYTVWEGIGTMHTVVGYGYLEYELYAANSYNFNLIFLREDKFAVVAWGWTSTKYAYIASDSASVSQAYSVTIEPVTIPGC
jgi:hypothetical protein